MPASTQSLRIIPTHLRLGPLTELATGSWQVDCKTRCVAPSPSLLQRRGDDKFARTLQRSFSITGDLMFIGPRRLFATAASANSPVFGLLFFVTRKDALLILRAIKLRVQANTNERNDARWSALSVRSGTRNPLTSPSHPGDPLRRTPAATRYDRYNSSCVDLNPHQEVAYVYSVPTATRNTLGNRPMDLALAKLMTSSWVSFIHDLDPNENQGGSKDTEI